MIIVHVLTNGALVQIDSPGNLTIQQLIDLVCAREGLNPKYFRLTLNQEVLSLEDPFSNFPNVEQGWKLVSAKLSIPKSDKYITYSSKDTKEEWDDFQLSYSSTKKNLMIPPVEDLPKQIQYSSDPSEPRAMLKPPTESIPHVYLHLGGVELESFDWELLRNEIAKSIDVLPSEVYFLTAEAGSVKTSVTLFFKNINKIKEKAAESAKKVKEKLEEIPKIIRTVCKIIKAVLVEPAKIFNPEDTGLNALSPQNLLTIIECADHLSTKLSEEERAKMKEITDHLESNLLSSLQHCYEELIVQSMDIVENMTSVKDFLASCQVGSQIPLLFHGTRIMNFNSIFEKGFKMGEATKLDDGWFGSGHYFSNSPNYALGYSRGYRWDPLPLDGFGVLIAANVRYSNRKEVTQKIPGSKITDSDCNHIVVCGPNFEPESQWEINSKKHTEHPQYGRRYEEFVVPGPDQILPLFLVTVKRVDSLILWRDPNIKSNENQTILKRGRSSTPFNIYGVETTEDGMEVIKRKKKNKIFLMTSGSGGEEFVTQARKELNHTNAILVFCGNVEYHQTWASKLTNVFVTSSSVEVEEFIRSINDLEALLSLGQRICKGNLNKASLSSKYVDPVILSKSAAKLSSMAKVYNDREDSYLYREHAAELLCISVDKCPDQMNTFSLARMYEQGWGVPQNYFKASQLYIRSGSGPSYFNASIITTDEGLKKTYLEMAKQKGYLAAEIELSTNNDQPQLESFKQCAITRNDFYSLSLIGARMKLLGNVDEAVDCWKKGVEWNDPACSKYLGEHYFSQCNYDGALPLLLFAGKSYSYHSIEYMIGICYLDGSNKNEREGLGNLDRAAMKGKALAIKKLESIKLFK
eukprot:TRINITY_DN1569_c7_g1_i2.p1 TRINITY_DN1569_c7_g1~~TRINITY_DN1569_c7_g1_i2.p1  ORF type:complete len:874 (-),score=207.25 TRINITY_DN1569_c7_g1_i2:205-2793(-)